MNNILYAALFVIGFLALGAWSEGLHRQFGRCQLSPRAVRPKCWHCGKKTPKGMTPCRACMQALAQRAATITDEQIEAIGREYEKEFGEPN
jgi:hypothetical protein